MRDHQTQPSYGRQDRDRRGFEDYGQRHGEVRRGSSREQRSRPLSGDRGRDAGYDVERGYGGSRSYASGRDYDYDQNYGESRYGGASSGRDEFGERDDYGDIGRRHFDDRFSVHGGLPAGGGERYAGESEYGYGGRGRGSQGERGPSWNQGGVRSDYDYYGRGRDPSGYGGGIYGGSATGGYPGYRESERGGRPGGEGWRRGGRDWGGMSGGSMSGEPGPYGPDSGRSWGDERGESGYGYGARGQQDFRGRGPKGYMRSDERISEDICERLTRDPEIDASEISVEVKDGTVTLRGSVDERWMKYRVEDVADGCSGVKDVRNELRLAKGAGGAGRAGAQGNEQEGSAAAATTASTAASIKH